MKNVFTMFGDNRQKPVAVEWICIAVMLFVSISLYCSSDLCVTSAHGVYLWDSLFSGNFTKLYTDYYNNSNTITAMYDVLLYIVFAIWNIPIYILHKFGISFLENLTTLKSWAMLWNKGLIVVFMWLFIYYIDKIAKEFSVDEVGRSWLKYSVLSSFIVIYPAMIVGQYDLIPVVFTLAGILAYLQKNYKKFLITFVFAVGMKFFAIFVFIPLVMMKEKNIFKIGGNCIVSFAIPLVTRILFRNDTAYLFSKEFSGQKMTLLLEKSFPGNFQEASIIIFLLMGVYIYAYIIKPINKVYILYMGLMVFSIMFSFMNFGTYWIIMIAPYMLLIMFINSGKKEVFQENLLLVALCEGSLFILNLYYHHDNLDYALLERGVFRNFFGARKPNFNFYDFISNMGYEKFMPCAVSLFIISLLAFILINFPNNDEYHNRVFVINSYNRIIMNMRNLIVFSFFFFTVVSYVIPIKYRYSFTDMSYLGENIQTINGCEVIENSMIFGPYCNLQRGTYRVQIYGENLDAEGIDYYIAFDGGKESIALYDMIKEEDYVEYKFIIFDRIEDIEFVVNVNSNQIVFKELEVCIIS